MRKRILTLTAVLVAAGCAGPRAYTKGVYADPNVIELLGDQFNENDLQLIAKKMVESMSGSAAFAQIQGRPLLLVGKMGNKTSEHIDMASLSDKVKVELAKRGRFAFVNKDAREQIAEEYEYQGSGYVDPSQAKGPGGQASADYLLTGAISSIVQEVGNDKVVYYKMTMELTNLRSGLIEWTDDKELRKKFVKRSVGW